MLKQAYAALIFTVLVSIYDAKLLIPLLNYNAYNVSKFMDSKLPIWTYNTTKSTYYTCFVDNVVNATKDAVLFNRSYYYKKWKNTTMEGSFQVGDASTMFIGRIGLLKTRIETLEFANGKYTCGIFHVIPTNVPGHGGWRDLRFKDENNTGKPEQECLEKFRRWIRKSRCVFYDFCTNPK
uniref:Lipocalin n=1 Tax=Rhipicephalus zambeziensis TaxID=60191 RepID=A0A224YM71_9ACAR